MARSFGLEKLGIVLPENPDLLHVPAQGSRRLGFQARKPLPNPVLASGKEPIAVLALGHLMGRVQGQFPGEEKKGAGMLNGPAAPEDIPHEHSRQKLMPRRQGPLHPYSQSNRPAKGIFKRQDQIVIFLSFPGHEPLNNKRSFTIPEKIPRVLD